MARVVQRMNTNAIERLHWRHPISTDTDSHTHEPAVDWFIFVLGAVILFSVVVPIVLAPQWSEGVINETYAFLTTRFGVLYVITAVSTFTFLIWLACSGYGRLQLGDGCLGLDDSTKVIGIVECQ